jgi:hypothetical protein
MMTRSQRAYHTIVQKLDSGGHSAYVQLWPFIIGTLLRQVVACADVKKP